MINLRLKALAVALLFLTFALTEFEQHQPWAGVGTAVHWTHFRASPNPKETPSLNWHFFANTFTGIDAPVQAFVSGVVNSLTSYLTPILRAMILVYVAANALIIAMNPNREPLTTFLRQVTCGRTGLLRRIVSVEF